MGRAPNVLDIGYAETIPAGIRNAIILMTGTASGRAGATQAR